LCKKGKKLVSHPEKKLLWVLDKKTSRSKLDMRRRIGDWGGGGVFAYLFGYLGGVDVVVTSDLASQALELSKTG